MSRLTLKEKIQGKYGSSGEFNNIHINDKYNDHEDYYPGWRWGCLCKGGGEEGRTQALSFA